MRLQECSYNDQFWLGCVVYQTFPLLTPHLFHSLHQQEHNVAIFLRVAEQTMQKVGVAWLRLLRVSVMQPWYNMSAQK